MRDLIVDLALVVTYDPHTNMIGQFSQIVNNIKEKVKAINKVEENKLKEKIL